MDAQDEEEATPDRWYEINAWCDRLQTENERLRAELTKLTTMMTGRLCAPLRSATSLSAQLRDLALDYPTKPYLAEAADEIERLCNMVVAADREIKRSHADADRLRAEIERLRDGEYDD
jgi:hypothetical protein